MTDFFLQSNDSTGAFLEPNSQKSLLTGKEKPPRLI